MRRRLFIFAAGLVLASASATYAEDARAILQSSLKAQPTFYGEQVSEVTTPGAAPRIVQRQNVFRKGNVLRINYRNGRVLFDDGKEAVLYLPRLNSVEHRPSSFTPEKLQKELRSAQAPKVGVTLDSEGTVAGRPAYVIAIAPPNGRNRKLWIDKEKYVQLRLDETRPNGDTISTYFSSITFADPPAAMLTFTPPAGAATVAPDMVRPVPQPKVLQNARAWGGPLVPKWLPAGFKLRGFYPHKFKEQQALVAVYDGPVKGETLSIFQGPVVGMEGMRKPGPRIRVVSARKGNADVMLVGKLPEPVLQRIMDSLAPQPQP